MQRIARWLVPIAALVVPCLAEAVWPLPQNQSPPLTVYPCGSGHPCNSCGDYPKNESFQVQGAPQSARTTTVPDSSGTCSPSNAYSLIVPQLTNPSASVFFDTSGPVVQLSVRYDFPNNYCIFWQDSIAYPGCPASLWPIPRLYGDHVHVTRLQLWEGSNLIHDVPTIFENGTWMPTLAASCNGSTHAYTFRATNAAVGAECLSPHCTEQTFTVTFPPEGKCAPDARPCPGCDQ